MMGMKRVLMRRAVMWKRRMSRSILEDKYDEEALLDANEVIIDPFLGEQDV